MSQKLVLSVILCVIFFITSVAVAFSPTTATEGLSFVVDTLADEPDASIKANPLDGADAICATEAGECSLRAAIMEANKQAGAVTITFSISGTITYTQGMPQINVPVTIEGPSGSIPQIVLDGSELGPTNYGLSLGGGNSVVRGLSIVNFPGSGIRIVSNDNVVQGNYLGLYPDGVTAGPNFNYGISVGSSNNLIGGTTPAARNIISGNNLNGILLNWNADDNTIQGNFIGTTPDGLSALPNRHAGIQNRSSNNLIGGDVPGAGNLLSGNGTNGIHINSLGSSNVKIQGNLIGTDITGNAPLGNQRPGIYSVGKYDNYLIGGDTEGARNVISGNGFSATVWGGIYLNGELEGTTIKGNYIGTNADGNAAIPNAADGIMINAFND